MREKRLKLIKKIQNIRGSKVIAYITGDRMGMHAQISGDAVRPIYQHLLSMKRLPKKRIDLLLYSRGGDALVPWQMVSMFRECAKEFNALIPYKAHSAATMIALGADNIILGKKSELGPIDPTLFKGSATGAPPRVNVEDVLAFQDFIKEKVGITDQASVTQLIELLIKHIQPLTIGEINRLHSHIRLVALKLLNSRNEKISEKKEKAIIQTLTREMYSHGHSINRKEAKEIGLQVQYAPNNLEKILWSLYNEYEEMLSLNTPFDPELILSETDDEERLLENVRIACIESEYQLDAYEHNVRLSRRRSIPPNPQININLNLQLPPDIDVRQLPQNIQQILQNLTQQVLRALPPIIQQEIIRQSPVIRIDGRVYGGRWRTVSE